VVRCRAARCLSRRWRRLHAVRRHRNYGGSGESSGVAYDAFISYSHAADGRLAPALQSGMQRLAKPWYRVRVLRVFRDETGLSTNPHLWSSIVVALDDAEWFVLLASPESAASPTSSSAGSQARSTTRQLVVHVVVGGRPRSAPERRVHALSITPRGHPAWASRVSPGESPDRRSSWAFPWSRRGDSNS